MFPFLGYWEGCVGAEASPSRCAETCQGACQEKEAHGRPLSCSLSPYRVEQQVGVKIVHHLLKQESLNIFPDTQRGLN